MYLNEGELRGDVKSPSGAYFFFGDEDYMKNYYAAAIKKAVISDEGLSAFNYVYFDDDSFEISAVRDAVMSPPFMSEKKLIDISAANLDKLMNERERGAFLSLVTEAGGFDDSVVILLRAAAGGFDAGNVKKPSGFLKNAEPLMKVSQFDYQADARLIRWIERHFAEYKLSVRPEVSMKILNTCGRSMFRLSGELAKTAAYVAAGGRSEVTAADVESSVTFTDEEDAFRLANCILAGDNSAALSALAVRMRRRDEPVVVLSQITRVFCDLAAAAHAIEDGVDKAEFALMMKMHTYKAGLYFNAARLRPVGYFDEAAARCAEADRKIKSTPLGYAVIERLICSGDSLNGGVK